jgi:hypothetical protein
VASVGGDVLDASTSTSCGAAVEFSDSRNAKPGSVSGGGRSTFVDRWTRLELNERVMVCEGTIAVQEALWEGVDTWLNDDGVKERIAAILQV